MFLKKKKKLPRKWKSLVVLELWLIDVCGRKGMENQVWQSVEQAVMMDDYNPEQEYFHRSYLQIPDSQCP